MNEIKHFIQLSETFGTSGQPNRDQFKLIAGQGYTSVVNLAMPDSEGAIPEEGSLVTVLGMNYFHLPVPYDAPGVGHLRKFIGIMKSLEPDKVWIHCALNARVSAFMYHYLSKSKGLPEEASKSVFFKYWEPRMEDAWKSFMRLTKDDIGL